MTRLFDAYVIVDWSANARPKVGPDSIWIGMGEWSGRRLRVMPSSNASTRAAACDDVRERLRALAAAQARVLVGFDFPYAYPRGFAQALGRQPESRMPAWRFMWEQIGAAIRDAPDNTNNRFEAAGEINRRIGPTAGPFWGGPRRCETQTFRATSPGFPYRVAPDLSLARLRLPEAAMGRRGQQLQDTWKLLGRGSVGSQALTGIPCVAALRSDRALRAHSRVWPFETGWTATPGAGLRPFILHAEIWPRVAPFVACATKVKDEIQVECLVRWLAHRDAAGTLGRLFDTPEGLSRAQLKVCLEEEGWILGA